MHYITLKANLDELSKNFHGEELETILNQQAAQSFLEGQLVRVAETNPYDRPMVIVTKDSLPEQVTHCRDGDHAEAVFAQYCREYLSNYDRYTAGDKEVLLKQGYERFGANGSIAIVWV